MSQRRLFIHTHRVLCDAQKRVWPRYDKIAPAVTLTCTCLVSGLDGQTLEYRPLQGGCQGGRVGECRNSGRG